MKHEKLCQKYGISISSQTMEDVARLVCEDIQTSSSYLHPKKLISLDMLLELLADG